ncbi:hypothetical protein TRFO_22800 [Tritrichomonas foetus]|uniref:Inner centromere protein ARK-binding domain-containing protein n=1 Tax=Tritrichomonas foetus TaxID=1144522 RepID=A0A1J4KG40_9EUKA|nr:hypothetical protein TRFO_22800 [Tritrichomonas foetus]|eukprot:OHT08614.1 hypothetical protein TRFO_22800 [Tritrichomonas foetus]
MCSIDDKLFKLNEMLIQETTTYEVSQKMQFEWLQTIKAQISFYSTEEESPKRHLSLQDSPQEGKQLKTPPRPPLSQTSPIKKLSPIPIPRPIKNPSSHNPDQSNANDKLAHPVARTPNRIHKKNENPQFSRNSQRVEYKSSKNRANNENINNESESESVNLPMSGNRSATSPCLLTNNIKFVDDDSILMESSSMSSDSDVDEDSEDPVPFTVSGSMRELTQSASSFREKWIEMLHQKKAATNIPKKPFKFAFDDYDDGIPENYQMSDDSENDEDEDEAMYERNPVEIHGKMIPIWARGDQLLRQLKRQQRIDPDSIFLGFTADCPLPELFGTHKARWENRQDSGWWDADLVTDEEVERFKAALGLQ